MNDTQQLTNEQKKENIIRALTITGFTENPEYPGMYAQINENIKTIVDLTAGTSAYLYDIVNTCKITDDPDGILKAVVDLITKAEDGKMPTKSDADEVVHVPKKDEINIDTPDIVTTMKPATPTNEQTRVEPAQDMIDTGNVPTVLNTSQALIPQVMPELSIEIIKKYINDKATDEEAYVFLQLCKARGLNPFLKEVHLIKYSHTEPASMVVGKDAFMKRAESHPQYDGFEAGIIIESGDDFKVVDEREGTYYNKDEKDHITGGWAKVYRKDQNHPIVAKVAFSEYVGINGKTGKPNRTWGSKPATMIRKVALVQSLREAFPSELSGMYDQSEMGVEVSA